MNTTLLTAVNGMRTETATKLSVLKEDLETPKNQLSVAPTATLHMAAPETAEIPTNEEESPPKALNLRVLAIPEIKSWQDAVSRWTVGDVEKGLLFPLKDWTDAVVRDSKARATYSRNLPMSICAWGPQSLKDIAVSKRLASQTAIMTMDLSTLDGDAKIFSEFHKRRLTW